MFDGSIGAGSVYMTIWWTLPAHRDTVNGCKASCIKGAKCDYSNNDGLRLSTHIFHHGAHTTDLYMQCLSLSQESLQQAEITAKSV